MFLNYNKLLCYFGAEYLSTNQIGQVGYILNWMQKSQVLRSSKAARVLSVGLLPSLTQGGFWGWMLGCLFKARSLRSFKLSFYTCKVKVLIVFTSEGCCEISV